jgi:hypothetical protein
MTVDGVLRPGERLDEFELCQRFKASRTPVRQAVRALTVVGLAEARRRQGLAVATISAGPILSSSRSPRTRLPGSSMWSRAAGPMSWSTSRRRPIRAFERGAARFNWFRCCAKPQDGRPSATAIADIYRRAREPRASQKAAKSRTHGAVAADQACLFNRIERRARISA